MSALKVEFRAEAFNTFNRVQFGPPDTTINDSTFGQVGLASRDHPQGLCNSGYGSSSDFGANLGARTPHRTPCARRSVRIALHRDPPSPSHPLRIGRTLTILMNPEVCRATIGPPAVR